MPRAAIAAAVSGAPRRMDGQANVLCLRAAARMDGQTAALRPRRAA